MRCSTKGTICSHVNAARPTTYFKGPDVMSKSLRSQQRHAKSWKGQTSLDGFLSLQESQPAIDVDTGPSITISDDDASVEILDLTAESDLEPSEASDTITPVIPQTRRVSDRETDSDEGSGSPEIVTRPPSSAAASSTRDFEEINEDLDEDIEEMESDSHIHGLGEEDAAEA